jgi:hypothetical protein
LSDPAYIALLALLLVASWRLAAIIAGRSPALIELTFWIFVYVWCALAPLSQMFPEKWPLLGSYSASTRAEAAAITVIGVGCWWIGYHRTSRRQWTSAERPVSMRRVEALGVLGAVVGLAAILKLGVPKFFSSRDQLSRAIENLAGGGPAQAQLVFCLITVPPTLALFLLLRQRSVSGAAFDSRTRLLVSALALIVLVTTNPVGNARYLSGSVLMALLVIRNKNFRAPFVRRVSSLVILLAVLLVFPIASVSRFADSTPQTRIRLDRELFQHGDYDAFQQTQNGVVYVDGHGASMGRQLAGVALFFVPRQLWPGKPEPTGTVVGRDAGYSFLNLSSPAWIEGYVDFLWVGAALVGLGLGALAGRLERALLDGGTSVWGAIAPLYIGYQITILRGSLLGVVPYIALWCVFAMAVTSRRR